MKKKEKEIGEVKYKQLKLTINFWCIIMRFYYKAAMDQD